MTLTAIIALTVAITQPRSLDTCCIDSAFKNLKGMLTQRLGLQELESVQFTLYACYMRKPYSGVSDGPHLVIKVGVALGIANS